MKPTNIVITAVGGQGAVLLSNIIGLACAHKGIEIKTAELHGLAQRSGSISIHLRIDTGAYGPLIPVGSADAIASMELTEALRYIEYLKPGGLVISSSRLIHPASETIEVSAKKRQYVRQDDVVGELNKAAETVLLFNGKDKALEAGSIRTENVVLLGALYNTGIIPLDEEDLLEAIKQSVPHGALEMNMKAFHLGKSGVEIVD